MQSAGAETCTVLETLFPIGTSPKSKVLGDTDQFEQLPYSGAVTAARHSTGAQVAAPVEIKLLAPLDPLIYDRRLTRRLWSYDYTWEVYTPPAKRVRGYYALPVLAGIELVGHIDPKVDRVNKKLMVVNRSVHRGVRVAGAVSELARFLGV